MPSVRERLFVMVECQFVMDHGRASVSDGRVS